MKNVLFMSLFSLSVFIKAQDSAYCYNSGITTSKTEETTTVENKQAHPLILMSYVMDQKEVIGFLKEKKNSSLDKLLAKIKLSKNLRLIGFAAVPAGIIGVLNISDANKDHSSQNVGLGFIGLSAVSLSSGFYFDRERKKNYKKAIAKYNQLYN